MTVSLVLTIIGAFLALLLAGRDVPKLWRDMKNGPAGDENRRWFILRHSFWFSLFIALPVVGLGAVGFQIVETTRTDRKSEQQEATIKHLQAAGLPRTITAEQRENFLAATKDAPKAPVWILCGDSTTETLSLISQMRQMLDEAGYSVGSEPVDSVSTRDLYGFGMQTGVFKMIRLPLTIKTNLTLVVAMRSLYIKDAPPHADPLIQGLKKAKIDFDIIPATDFQTGKVAIVVPSKFGS